MIRLLTILLFVVSTQMVAAQDYVIPLGEHKKLSTAGSTVNSISSVKMHFTLDALYGVTVQDKEYGEFVDLYFGKGYATGKIGEPKLPAYKQLIQIPNGATVTAQVNGYSQQDISLAENGIDAPIYPNQPSARKNDDPQKLPLHYNKSSYLLSYMDDEPQVQISILGTLRGVRIALLQVNPVQYNPVENTIRIFNDIDVEILINGGSAELENDIRRKTFSPYFEPIFSTLSNPYTKDIYEEQTDLTKYPVGMVVVSHRSFEEKLQPFIQWKTEKGFSLEVAYTDEIGETAADIKSYISSAYSTGEIAPTFLVLVGDVDKVPASATGTKTGRATDLYYASVDGDQFPEMYYGRLSAQTPEELENIVSKILYYEKYQFSIPSYLNNATLIAGEDASWNPRVGEPTVKYATQNYFNSTYGFNTVWGYGVENDPNNPNNNAGYTGCYDSQRISVGFINYTAHCSQTTWGDPLLNANTINGFSNSNQYPFVIGNCCESADFGFTGGVSIGESWIRAKDKGAVTYIGSSPNTYWFEDFYWSVGAFPLQGTNDGYVPSFEESSFGAYDAPFNTQYLSASGLVFIGNLAVTEAHIEGYSTHSSTLYYWEAYNVLGDPSLVPYFTEAELNDVDHIDILPIGVSVYQVSALPGSYVAISKDGILLGSALVGLEGSVNVIIQPVFGGGNVTIVVTRPQTQPYFSQVPAAILGEPHVTLMEYTLNDPSGNNNSLPDYGEEFSMDISLKNIGDQDTDEVTVTFAGHDDYFTLTSSASIYAGVFGSEPDNSSKIIEDAFSLSLSDEVPNGHKAVFTLEISDGSKVWKSYLQLKALAPHIKLGTIEVDDSGEGTPNHLDPGEDALLTIEVLNSGDSPLNSISVYLTTTSSNIILGADLQTIDELAPGDKSIVSYPISALESVPLETIEVLNIRIEPQSYGLEHEVELMVGKLPEIWMGSSNSVSTCLARFYDSGGPDGDYSDNEEYTMTIYPDDEGKAISAEFSYAFIEGASTAWDKLYVFDGVDTTSAYFTGSPYSNSNGVDIGTLTATNPYGAITFYFTSDGSIVYKGWEALISCIIPEYIATFMVSNAKNESLENAIISIVGYEKPLVTDQTGQIDVKLKNGEYSFTVQATGYQQMESTFQIAGRDVNVPVSLTRELPEETIDSAVIVQPNPFNDYIRVTGIANAKHLVLTNMFGQKLASKTIVDEHSVTVSTASLPSGVYILTLIYEGNEKKSFRVIKP